MRILKANPLCTFLFRFIKRYCVGANVTNNRFLDDIDLSLQTYSGKDWRRKVQISNEKFILTVVGSGELVNLIDLIYRSQKTLKVFLTFFVLFFSPVGNSQWIMPVDTENAVFSYGHLSHFSKYMYHTGADFKVKNENTVVRAAAEGDVVAVWGLAPGGSENEENVYCIDGNEQIRLWDDSNTNNQVDHNELSDSKDLTNPDATKRLATCTGRRVTNHALGMTVLIKHDENLYSQYSHLSAIHKGVWEAVIINGTTHIDEGSPLGVGGGSGKLSLNFWGPHLHFEVKSAMTIGSPFLDDESGYWGYTPDIPNGYGYIDPRTKIILQPPATPSSVAVKIIGNEAGADDQGVRIQSGPGTKYDTLGWTGINQRFFSDSQSLSTMPGDDIEGRLWYRIHMPSRMNNVLNHEPVTGWIASKKKDGTTLIEEDNSATILEIEHNEGKGWEIRPDVVNVSNKCNSSSGTPTCVSVWDSLYDAYKYVRVWNGNKFVQRNSKEVNGVKWYEIDIPKNYFTNKAAVCENGPFNDQCPGEITQGWLPEDAVRIYHANVSQNVDVALIIDSSGSMTSNDPLDKRLQAARTYLTASLDGDYVGVVDFDNFANIVSPLFRLPDQKEYLKAVIDNIDSLGGTNIGDALLAGCNMLSNSPSKNDARAAILLTDGVGAYSGEETCYTINGWPVFTFAIGSADRTLLENVAAKTGGEFKDLPTSQLVCEFQSVRAKIAGVIPGACSSYHLMPLSTIFLQLHVAPIQALATFTSSWLGSDIIMTLVSPSGEVINRDSIVSGVTHDKGESFEVFTVSNPEEGEWEIQLYGAELPEEGEEVVLGLTTIPRIERITGDIDQDGDVDRDDLNILMGSRSQTATGTDDPKDLDHDGMITGLDARKLSQLCTRSRCSTE